jgi:hypothetical protein
MNELALSDENLDKISEDVSSVESSAAEVAANMKSSDKAEIKNDQEAQNEDEVALGELGNFKKCTAEDLQEVFDHLPGTIFQLKKCLFRVSYINRGNGRFTGEIINLE